MKRYILIILAILAIAVIAVWKLAFFKVKPPHYWYQVKIERPQKSFDLFGSSPLDEKQFAKQMGTQEFLVLENVIYFDEHKQEEGESGKQPSLENRVYLNPKYIIAFQPLSGDPREGKTPQDRRQ
jgi:hypothetical protein